MTVLQHIYQATTAEDLWQSTNELQRNEYLKVAGSVDLNIYYIVAGSIRVFVYSESEEHTIRFGYPGDFVVALDSYFLQRPSDLYLQALRQTTIQIMQKRVFEEWVYRDVDHLKLWNDLLQGLVVDQLEREQDLLISSPQERYQRVLTRSPQLFQQIPHKYIANYLRMTPETLSRVKKS